MVKVGIAARKRESKQRTCAIVSLVFSFLSIALLFAGAYVHDLNLGTQQTGAADVRAHAASVARAAE